MADSPGHLILDVEWPQAADGTRREVFGPWAEAEDDSHLEEILRLIRSLGARTGPHPKTVTLILLTSPAEWLAAGGGGAEPPHTGT